MRRLLPVAVLFIGVPLAVSAPVPKDLETPEKKIERLFGKPVTPKGTKVELGGSRLKLTVEEQPGVNWDMSEAFFDCPRTERVVAGDFEFTVRLAHSAATDAVVKARAGLYVRFGRSHFFAYLRRYDSASTDRQRFMQGRMSDGRWWTMTGAEEPPDAPVPVSLRVARRGNDLVGHAKFGSGEWASEIKLSADLPKEVTVGTCLYARRTPFTAEFEDFKVTPLK